MAATRRTPGDEPRRPATPSLTPGSRAYRAVNTGVTVLLLATVVVTSYAAAAAIWISGLPLVGASLSLGPVPGVVVGVVLAAVSLAAALALGLAATRTLSRLVPLGVAETPERTWRTLAAFSILGILLFGTYFVSLAADVLAGRPTDDPVFTLWPAVAAGLAFGVTIGTVSSRHRRASSLLGRPFVLFLRRFSTYSDRVVLGECLRASPPGVPLALLVPTNARLMDWNPVSLAFAGLRLRRPFRSLPLFVQADDAHWEGVARDLIARADRIVFDVSDRSDSISLEESMVSDAGRWAHVVALVEDGDDGGPQAATGTEAGCVVPYRRVWAPGQLLFGVLVSATATGGLMTLVEALPGMSLAAMRWLGVGAWAVLFLVFFFRPGMSEQGSRALRRALADRPPG